MSKDLFTDEDRTVFEQRGITEDAVIAQVRLFTEERRTLTLNRPCRVSDGIAVIGDSDIDGLAALHDGAAAEGRMTKFVPASGAASRMFRDWYGYYTTEGFDGSGEGAALVRDLPGYAFYRDLTAVLSRDGEDLQDLSRRGRYRTILEYILTDRGLNYVHLPKALIAFHAYGDHARTALEEHLVEAASYVRDASGRAAMHVTLSAEHQRGVEAHIERVRKEYEGTLGVTFDISLSLQHPSTDTIAVDGDNRPFRDASGRLVFRPGGHGALLKNLGEIGGDIIFVKNIDNVVPDRMKDETIRYKKVLGGYLVALQGEVFRCLRMLEQGAGDEKGLTETTRFAGEKLSLTVPADFHRFSPGAQRDFLFDRLNRPLRVCGVVKNEGEPGGGPFWVDEEGGMQSLQIVESVQIDRESEAQRDIWRSATHFNPVDLVCGVRDFRGEPFDLGHFVDREGYIVAEKSFEGRGLRALEHPGLWNGAMARWNTVFVEVPLATFNPVKTIDDLLRREHRE